MIVLGAAVIAAVGLYAHNMLSLPLSPLALENTAPIVLYLVLAAWYIGSHASAGARVTLGGWTALSLVAGGILTALPLPFLPFAPEQTAGHYAAHAIYAIAQLPLLYLVSIGRPRGSQLPSA